MDQKNPDLELLSATIYDRQIRLWGLDGQRRITDASVIVTGKLGGIAVEIVKNLALAGVGCIHLVDDSVICEEDLSCSIAAAGNVGLLRAQVISDMVSILNPYIKVTRNAVSMESFISLESDNGSIIKAAGVVIACNLSGYQTGLLGEVTRHYGVQLVVARVMGQFGLTLADLIDYESLNFTSETKQNSSNEFLPMKNIIEKGKCITFSPRKPRLESIRSKNTLFYTLALLRYELKKGAENHSSGSLFYENELNYEDILKELSCVYQDFEIVEDCLKNTFGINNSGLREFLDFSTTSEFLPVCAVLAGFVAQEVVKILQLKPSLIKNVAVYSALDLHGTIFNLSE